MATMFGQYCKCGLLEGHMGACAGWVRVTFEQDGQVRHTPASMLRDALVSRWMDDRCTELAAPLPDRAVTLTAIDNPHARPAPADWVDALQPGHALVKKMDRAYFTFMRRCRCCGEMFGLGHFGADEPHAWHSADDLRRHYEPSRSQPWLPDDCATEVVAAPLPRCGCGYVASHPPPCQTAEMRAFGESIAASYQPDPWWIDVARWCGEHAKRAAMFLRPDDAAAQVRLCAMIRDLLIKRTESEARAPHGEFVAISRAYHEGFACETHDVDPNLDACRDPEVRALLEQLRDLEA